MKRNGQFERSSARNRCQAALKALSSVQVTPAQVLHIDPIESVAIEAVFPRLFKRLLGVTCKTSACGGKAGFERCSNPGHPSLTDQKTAARKKMRSRLTVVAVTEGAAGSALHKGLLAFQANVWVVAEHRVAGFDHLQLSWMHL
jgi:hypothetical protein